jgi:TrmH family RNA methyltransferase
MTLAALILVEPSLPGNLGAAMRVAANFGVRQIELVRPSIGPEDPEVRRWACGAELRVAIRSSDSFGDATAPYRTVAASASGRGRPNQPLLTPREAAAELAGRGLDECALVFGNETRGLSREHLDRCDMVIRIPTVVEFPVLNVTQAVAILLAYLSMEAQPPESLAPPPAPQREIDGLMEHLRESLLAVGFLDPASPQRILRKLRRLFGRAAITANEVDILRGICRQMLWAARTGPLADKDRGGRWQRESPGSEP